MQNSAPNKNTFAANRVRAIRRLVRVGAAVLAAGVALAQGGCEKRETAHWQGWLEAEFTQVASPLGGRLETLSVAKGGRVAAGAPLFTLESASERAALDEAQAAVRAADARLADLEKGARRSELAAVEARLTSAKTRADFAAVEAARLARLVSAKAVSQNDADRARHESEAAAAAVLAIEAELATARLGGREDALNAARAQADAARAAVARAQWALAQKTQAAPRGGLVFETLFREGEFVAAGRPVVALLPAEFLKARFFVPAEALASLPTGALVRVFVDGCAEPLAARVSFVSPSPEYTPPVLYNRDSRPKLLFRVEAFFENGTGAGAALPAALHPGQPVEVVPAQALVEDDGGAKK